MENIAYYNGEYAPLEELRIPVLDRAVYFGDGVYEAVYFNNGIPFVLADHLRRFERSLKFARIEPAMSTDELEALVRELCGKVGGEGIVYWQTSRGSAPRSHTFEAGMKSNMLAWAKKKPLGDITKKFDLITVPDIRYKMCNVKTLNLMPNILAAQAAKEAGCDEAVFVRDGFVSEGAHTNVHILKDGRIITHQNGELILPGTVRGQLIEACDTLGIEVVERPFTPDEMADADEILITSATSFFRVAKSLDGKPVGGKDADTVRRLNVVYLGRLKDETGDLPTYLADYLKS